MNRRSLSLVEVLIAVTLLLGVAAIVTPYVVDSLDERAFQAAADVTGEQLLLARAHAQATGQSVEVRYRRDDSAVEARIFSPWLGTWGSPSAIDSQSSGPRSSSSFSGAESERSKSQPSVIAEPWANRTIGKSVRIASRPSAGSPHETLRDSLAGDVRADIEAELTTTDDIRLAVFMPDGSALLGDPFWFEDEDGRIGKLTVNPFSGQPIWERLEDLTATAPGTDRNGTGEESS